MRIVQVANFVHPGSGGVRVVIEELSAQYAARGHDVMSIQPGDRYRLTQDDQGRVRVQVPGVPLPGSGGYRLLVRRRPLEAIIASWRADLIEVHDTSTLTWLGAAGHAQGATTVLFVHERLGLVLGDHLRRGGNGALRTARWHHRRAVRHFDHVVAPSRFAAAEVEGLAEAVVVPWGVDARRFHPDLRHRAGQRGGRRRVMLVSRLSREKRPLLAVSAIAELRRRGHDVELVVAGDGPLRADVAEGDGVVALGHVTDRDQLAALIADADAVVCPGPRETFGLAALEALACGTPVACIGPAAISELLAPGAGVGCAARPDALADGLERLLLGDRAAQRRAARARAEQFTWDAAASSLLAWYRPSSGSLVHRLPTPSVA